MNLQHIAIADMRARLYVCVYVYSAVHCSAAPSFSSTNLPPGTAVLGPVPDSIPAASSHVSGNRIASTHVGERRVPNLPWSGLASRNPGEHQLPHLNNEHGLCMGLNETAYGAQHLGEVKR